MKKYTEKIPSRDGKTDINVVVWESKQPTAVLQLIHGMSEYKDNTPVSHEKVFVF